MIAAAALALLLPVGAAQEGGSEPLLRLVYLARHQGGNGAWGDTPDACTCPRPPAKPPAAVPVDEAVQARVSALVEALGADSIEERERAQAELLKIGLPAALRLERAAGGADAERAGRARELHARITHVRGLDDFEATGLALLAFMAAGYSHLSRDEYPDPCHPGRMLCFGVTVKRGLRWLLDAQDEKGCFNSDDAVANAVATLAVLEAYGMTGSVMFKGPAERGAAWVSNTTSHGVRFNAWKGMVVHSALVSDVPGGGRPGLATVGEALTLEKGTLALSGAFLMKSWATGKKDEKLMGEIEKFDPARLSGEDLQFATAAVFRSGGPNDLRWKEWSARVREQIIVPAPRSIVRGCLTDAKAPKTGGERIRSTAIDSLSVMLVYRTGNHFAGQ